MFTRLSKFRIFICSILILTFLIGIIYLFGGIFFVIKENEKDRIYLWARLNILREFWTWVQVRSQGNLLISTKELNNICQIHYNDLEGCKLELEKLQIVTCNDVIEKLKSEQLNNENLSLFKNNISLTQEMCANYQLNSNIERKNIITYSSKELLLYNTFKGYGDDIIESLYNKNEIIEWIIWTFIWTLIFWFLVEWILFILNNKIGFIIWSKK